VDSAREKDFLTRAIQKPRREGKGKKSSFGEKSRGRKKRENNETGEEEKRREGKGEKKRDCPAPIHRSKGGGARSKARALGAVGTRWKRKRKEEGNNRLFS